jgi:hypothetical protein
MNKEMINWFYKRTENHISLVNSYCKKLYDFDPDVYKELLERGAIHDESKFYGPEVAPYVYVTWEYYCKDNNIPFEVDAATRDAMHKATEHHIHNNSHHPEFFDKNSKINKEDKDKSPQSITDATIMSDIDIAEMCCDWCAMSKEKGSDGPFDWADKNIGKRWKFTDAQIDYIYTLLDFLWND